jgi:hypothetical protein
MTACVTQQQHLGNVPDITDAPGTWVAQNSYVWASSPGWGEKWDYALATHPPSTDPESPPSYDPGADASVITDGDILATVQALGTEEATT